MSSKAMALELFQRGYYDAVDRGDMAGAASVFTEGAEWSHRQVWAHHDYLAENPPTNLIGRAAIAAFLGERVGKLADAAIRHRVRDMVFEDGRGSFIGAVEGAGPDKLFLVWFELSDDKVSRYLLRPL